MIKFKDIYFDLINENTPSKKIAGKIGSFEIPKFNNISELTNWMVRNKQNFLSALSSVGGSAMKFNTMESLFRLAESGDIKVGQMIGNVRVEEYITRQGGLRDEFVRLLGQSKPASVVSDIRSSGEKIVKNNADLPKEDLNYLLNAFGDVSKTKGWKVYGKTLPKMSGWKFHIYGEDLYDSYEIYTRTKPVVDKWGASAKVGVMQDFQSYDMLIKQGYLPQDAAKNSVQFGKKGASIYIPPEIIRDGKQREFLMDIQTAMQGYRKKGSISGDQQLTDNITYRYELKGPIDSKTGVDYESYNAMYQGNAYGAQYKPSDVPDLFTGKK